MRGHLSFEHHPRGRAWSVHLVGATCALLLALPAFAQGDGLFASGKPPTYREEAMDRKFAKSKLAKLLKTGTQEPACVELLGGLFVALAELGPYVDKRTDEFFLHPALGEAVSTQLTTPRFPAMANLVLMMRRVMIDRRLPDEWLATAQAINTQVKIIDLAKLKMLNEQVSLIDSFGFTIPELRRRYVTEALGANSAVTTDVLATFRDRYLDRDIAWGGAVVVDVGINQPKGKKKRRFASAEPEELVAVLQWVEPEPKRRTLDLLGATPTKTEPIVIYARLQPKQFADIEKLYRNQRVVVKGRLWEMNKTMTEIEVRDALLFNDNDWDQGVILGAPQEIEPCPAAINEITGLAPSQPGGFQH